MAYSDEPDPYIAMAMPDEEFIDVEVLKPVGDGPEDVAPALTPEDRFDDSQVAPESGTNLTSQGPVDKPAKTVTSRKDSPLTEKQQPKTPPASAVDKKAEEEKALAKRTENLTKNAFANAESKGNAQNGKKDEGTAGKKDGNPDSAGSPSATGKRPGVSGTVGGGWKMPEYSRNIPSNEVGKVTFEVKVNSNGTVEKITQIDNSGLTSTTIARCREEIKRHRFTHPHPETAEATTARVTFTFVDPK